MFTFLHRLFRRMAVATRFDELVQPVGEAKCVRCHSAKNKSAAKFDLTAPRAYESLINYGKPSLRDTCVRVMLKAVRSQAQAQHRPACCCHFLDVTLFARRCSMQLRAKDLSRRWMSRDSAWDRSVKSRGD